MPTVRVGETRLPKNFKRYAKQFSLLELDCEPGNVPGKARLEACAAAAPPGFTFSLVVPSRLASLSAGPEVDKRHAERPVGSSRHDHEVDLERCPVAVIGLIADPVGCDRTRKAALNLKSAMFAPK